MKRFKIYINLEVLAYKYKIKIVECKKMRNNNKIILISVVLILVLASTASATTLKVGSHEKYKTIQSAVNAAKNGDTIKVSSGTYKEDVNVNKDLIILGTKYPKIDGFTFAENLGTGTINGFTIQKNGVYGFYAGGYSTIKNNYFNNCGISLQGLSSSGANIINNQIRNSGIYLQDTGEQIIKGNIITNSKYGVYVDNQAIVPTITMNTFKNCKYAIYLSGWEKNPGKLSNVYGNKYIKNKVNLGWGTSL